MRKKGHSCFFHYRKVLKQALKDGCGPGMTTEQAWTVVFARRENRPTPERTLRASRTAMKQSDNSVKLENLMPAGPFMKRTGARVEIEEGKATRMLPMRREFTMPPTPCMAHFIFGHWTTRPFSRPTLAEDVLVLAINFTTDLTRPVSADTVTAFGKVINTDRSPFNQDSVFYDDHRRGFNFSDPVVKSQTIIVSV